jgi:hypothetical protein
LRAQKSQDGLAADIVEKAEFEMQEQLILGVNFKDVR